MTALLVALMLGAGEPAKTGEVAVLVVRRTSVTVPEGRALADAAFAALKAKAVAVEAPQESLRRLSSLGVSDPTVCTGRKACVLELAKQLEVPAVVSISAAQLQGERSVVLEAWRTADGVLIAKDAVVLKAGAPLLPEHVEAVTRALAAAYPAAPVKAAAEPVKTAVVELKPEPKPEPVVTVPPEAVTPGPATPSRSHVPGILVAGAAIGAAAVAIGLGASALSARGELGRTTTVGQQTVSVHSGSQAQALADRGNLHGGVAAGLAAAALAFGVTAVLVW